MFSLVYKSIAKPDFALEAINDMLEHARIYNNSQGITGCLLYYEGSFIQYLEGSQIKVLTLFDKIKEDRRHKDVLLLSHGESENREFTSWDMAFENFNGENEHLSFLKLFAHDYTEEESIFWEGTAKVTFWKEVSKLINKKSTLKSI